MFSQLRRVPLRRCLHTQAPKSLPKARSYKLGFSLAASATVVSYSAWRWTRDQHIALDTATVAESVKVPARESPSSDASTTPSKTPEGSAESQTPSSETEASDSTSQSAYNPETGEINWDCPCLGGMADGPCGPEFREAFSCFIYSEEEPKGINCVEKFQAMQTCFRAHPEVYADEIVDDDEEEGKTTEGAAVVSEKTGAPSTETESVPPSHSVPTSHNAEKAPSSSQNASA